MSIIPGVFVLLALALQFPPHCEGVKHGQVPAAFYELVRIFAEGFCQLFPARTFISQVNFLNIRRIIVVCGGNFRLTVLRSFLSDLGSTVQIVRFVL